VLALNGSGVLSTDLVQCCRMRTVEECAWTTRVRFASHTAACLTVALSMVISLPACRELCAKLFLVILRSTTTSSPRWGIYVSGKCLEPSLIGDYLSSTWSTKPGLCKMSSPLLQTIWTVESTCHQPNSSGGLVAYDTVD
jgi:hypothetical protein